MCVKTKMSVSSQNTHKIAKKYLYVVYKNVVLQC